MSNAKMWIDIPLDMLKNRYLPIALLSDVAFIVLDALSFINLANANNQHHTNRDVAAYAHANTIVSPAVKQGR